MDNRERLALAEKVQKCIEERTINYPFLQRREELEEEFKRSLQNK